jgi:hypothetical protein
MSCRHDGFGWRFRPDMIAGLITFEYILCSLFGDF